MTRVRTNLGSHVLRDSSFGSEVAVVLPSVEDLHGSHEAVHKEDEGSDLPAERASEDDEVDGEEREQGHVVEDGEEGGEVEVESDDGGEEERDVVDELEGGLEEKREARETGRT